ncbi:MAG: efflux RND transporter periplasmic adaptor subunit [Thiohalobacteraceae bacterium]
MRIDWTCALLLWCASSAAFAHSDASGFAAGGPVAGAGDAAVASTGAAPGPLRVDSDLVTLAAVQTPEVVEHRAGVGRVIAGAGAVHDVNSFISGQLRELYVRPGSRVRRGEPIALIESPEFVLTQKAYIALLNNDEKLEILREEGRLPNYLKDARENLRWWGMSDKEIAQLEESGEALDGISVEAPIDGVISEVLVRPGALLNAGDRAMSQFVVLGRAIARVIAADAPLWVEGLFFPDQLAGVRAQDVRVRIRFPDGREREYQPQGVSPQLDDARQLARLLVQLDKGESAFLGQAVEMELLIARPGQTWVPRAALMHQGLETVLFLQTEPGAYVRRVVEPGVAVGDWVPVTGIDVGSQVVTQGKLLLEGAYRLDNSSAAASDHHH